MSYKTGLEFVDEAGASYGVKHIGNKPRVSAMPYIFDIAEGNVAGHQIMRGFGSRPDVQVVVNGSDLWTGTAPSIPIPASTGVQMFVVSTDAEDGVGGTGIRTIDIHALDADGVPFNETLTMNGTTPVQVSETNTRFVQGIHALTVGSVGKAVGTITIYLSGSATTVYNQISTGNTVSLSTNRMIPANKTLYLTSIHATASDSLVAEVRLEATSLNGELIEGVFLTQDSYYLLNSTINIDIPPLVFPAFTIVKMDVHVPSGKAGAYVSGGWQGWIE